MGEQQTSADSRNDPNERSLLVQAWIDNRMERDRTLISLSAGGLALLAGILTAKGANGGWQVGLFIMAAAAFVVAIVSGLAMYYYNTRYLESILKSGSSAESGPVDRCTAGLFGGFGLGVLSTLALTLCIATKSA